MTDRDDAMAAMDSAVEDLEDLHATADNAAIAGKREQEVIDEFTETVAQALADGLNDPVGLYAGAAADVTEYYSKTDIKQKIKDRSESVSHSDKPPLDEFVEDELESVTVTKTTDRHQGAIYVWDFGEFKVETESGTDRRQHFSFPSFRDFIFESGGLNVGRPTENRRDGADWRDFIVDIIDERGVEQTNVGPRTAAVEDLANKIRRRVGYAIAEDAVDHSGIWVVTSMSLPDWWVPDWWQDGEIQPRSPSDEHATDRNLINIREIRVHESLIAPLIDDSEITRSALYHELDARCLTIPGTPGTSMTEWVNGRTERFWALRPDIATPEMYVPDVSKKYATCFDWLIKAQAGGDDTATADSEPLGMGKKASADGGSVSEQDDDSAADTDDDADSTTSTTFESVGGDDDE